MAAAPTESIVLYHLDPKSSAAVIAQAIEVQVTIRIFADTDLSVVLLEGVLTDNIEGNLSVLVTNENTSGLAMNVLANFTCFQGSMETCLVYSSWKGSFRG